MSFLLLPLLLPPLPQTPDVRLEGPRLERFLKTKGGSEAGRSVRWSVPARVFARPERQRRGHDLYLYKGIGLVIGSTSADLLEIRRRGGRAVVRGRVFRVPTKARRKGDSKGRKEGAVPAGPGYAIDIREIRARR